MVCSTIFLWRGWITRISRTVYRSVHPFLHTSHAYIDYKALFTRFKFYVCIIFSVFVSHLHACRVVRSERYTNKYWFNTLQILMLLLIFHIVILSSAFHGIEHCDIICNCIIWSFQIRYYDIILYHIMSCHINLFGVVWCGVVWCGVTSCRSIALTQSFF